MRKVFSVFAVMLLVGLQATAAAADIVRGKIIKTEGHVSPNCRTVTFKRSDNGQMMLFRIAATGQEDGVLAVTLTALTTGLDVAIAFEQGQTSGCGTEPRIIFITLIAAGY